MENKDVPQEGEFKMKKRPKKLVQKKTVNKVDLTKKEEPKKEETINKVENVVETKTEEQKQPETETTTVIEEITPQQDEKQPEKSQEEVVVINEKKYDNVEENKTEPKQFEKPETKPEINLPENVEKLVSFMRETGGTVEDYVTLNKDYSQYDDTLLVREYYKKTRPHLSDDEVSFIMEDNFKYDEEVDEERFVKKQKNTMLEL